VFLSELLDFSEVSACALCSFPPLSSRYDFPLPSFASHISASFSLKSRSFFVDVYFSGAKFFHKIPVGRGVRLHPKKEFLTVFDYQDQMKGSSFMNHWKERNKLYRTEGHDLTQELNYEI
jgi:hypothetical protein